MCFGGIGSKRLSSYDMIRPRIEYGSLCGFLAQWRPPTWATVGRRTPSQGQGDLPVTLAQSQDALDERSVRAFPIRGEVVVGCSVDARHDQIAPARVGPHLEIQETRGRVTRRAGDANDIHGG